MSRGPSTLRAVSLQEVLLTVRVWVFVSLLGCLVRLCGVPRLLRLSALRAPRPPEDEALVVACVDRVFARHPGISRSPCLKRSLTLYRFLGAAVSDLQFCLGVRYAEAAPPGRRARRLAGHAWLLRNGLPYLESDHSHVRRFRVIYRYPTGERSAA